MSDNKEMKQAPTVEAGARVLTANEIESAADKLLGPYMADGYSRATLPNLINFVASLSLFSVNAARASEAAAGEPVGWFQLKPELGSDRIGIRWNGDGCLKDGQAIYADPQPASEQQINRMTEEDVERQYRDGVHIGSGLPRETCPCGLCEKHRFGFNRASEETAPCPLCGGHMTYEHDAGEVSPYGHYFSCDRCAMTTGSSPSKEAAIAACNRKFASEQQAARWLSDVQINAIEYAQQVLRQVEVGDGVFVGQCAEAIKGLDAILAAKGDGHAD